MIRRIVTALLVVTLFAAGYMTYLRYKENRRFVDGEVTFGDVRDSDGVPAHATPSRSDDPGTINTAPAETAPRADVNAPTAAPIAQAPAAAAPAALPVGKAMSPTAPLPAMAAPASDSQSPNAPNGVGFAGTGRFQVYRQGNLTWRVNTETGSTCILFATNEEWRKPIVYNHGCNV